MKKGWVLSTVLGLSIVVILAGCSGNNSTSSGGNEDKPAEVSIMVPGELELTAANDRIFAELEKRLNMTITIVSIPWDNYSDKMNVMAAGGELSDIVTVIDNTKTTLWNNWIDQGLLIPFEGDVLDAAPEIAKQYETTSYYQELKVDGKMYFQPIFWDTGLSNANPMHVRKDLLDELGLQAPETLDELYTAMKRLKDEKGLYVGTWAKDANPMNNFSGIAGAYGLPLNGWMKGENGDYVYANVQPQMLDAIKWVKRLYSEGIADPESFTLEGTADGPADTNYFTGKYSFYMSNGGGHIPRFQENLQKNFPNAQEYLLPAPAGPDGKRGYAAAPSFWGMTAISSKAKDPVAAAKLINYLVSEEGQLLTQFGIEGIHYSYEGGKELKHIVLHQEERDKEGADHWDSGRYHQLAAPYVSWVPQAVQDFFAMYGKPDEVIDWYAQMWDNQTRYIVTNEIMLNTTPKWNSFSSTNTDLTNEYFNKIILSKKDDADELFQEYVDKWTKAGGEEAAREMSEAAKALKDK